MTQIVLTAYDLKTYLADSLPAMRAAVFRNNLSVAKDVLAPFGDSIIGEWDLTDTLANTDYSWIFTEKCAAIEDLDYDGDTIGLTYPLILAFHKPQVFRLIIAGSSAQDTLPIQTDLSAGLPGILGTSGLVQAGFKEGLRAMWEIIGYITPENTEALRDLCLTALQDLHLSHERAFLYERLINGLHPVIQRHYGLVVERD